MARQAENHIIEKMLSTIRRQERGQEECFILEKLSKKDLKKVKQFLKSFDYPDQAPRR